ncbi:MAG: T9SS type B sorting domain-containing protein [Flavobacteriales bacterium]|nr:T9SS type B sorting domain-containing protein [Flavobacteriales bacterium]
MSPSTLQGQCPPTATEVQGVSCSGADDAILSVSVPLGADSAQVFWVTGLDTLYGAVLSGMGPGTYSVFVPGCFVPDFVFVAEPPPISIFQIASTPPTCDEPCSGTATVQAIGGTAPYTYSWAHDPLESSDAASGLCEGVTAVGVVDDLGCATASQVFLQIPIPTAAISVAPQTCEGLNDAAASASASGGSGGPYTFIWDHGPTSDDLTGLPPGSYGVTATDAGGCTAYASTTIAVAPPLEVTATATDIVCWGDLNGSISATAAGQDPIDYNWSGPFSWSGSGAGHADLPAGTYTVTALDALGCQGSATATVESPAPLSAELLAIPPTCPGESTGTVAAAPSGGTPDYTAQWTLPSGGTLSGLALQNLPQGFYSIALSDNNGCNWNGGIELSAPPPLVVNFELNLPSCNGLADGSIFATPSGGTGDISITWTLPSGPTTGFNLTGLPGGTYPVQLLDQAGCTLDTIAVLLDPAPLSLDLTYEAPLCAGELTGFVSAIATGGTPPWNYALNGPTGPAVGPDHNNLPAGNYTITVVDTAGCTYTEAFTLEPVDPLLFNAVALDVSCQGADGAILATPSGGTPGHTVSWTDGITVWETASVSDLPPATYFGLCTDAVGCAITAELTIGTLPPLTASFNIAPPLCAGSTAALTAAPAGGSPPYISTLSTASDPTPIPADPPDSFTWPDLPAGDYIYNLTDVSGCSFDTSFALTAPAPLSATIDVTGISCFGLSDGSITLTPEGGTPSYSATWADAPALPAPALVRENLAPGNYIVTLEDDAGCTLTPDTIWVDAADALQLTVNPTPESCDGIVLGSVTLQAEGGHPAYTLTLDGLTDPSATDSTAQWTGLQAGVYAAVLTDNSGCTASAEALITAPDPFTWNVTVTDSACVTSPGGIAITWEGGTAPFTWSGAGAGGLWSSPDTTGLSPGAYAIEMMDAAGCLADSVVTVGLVASLNISLDPTHPACAGESNGSLLATVVGGTAPIDLTVDGPAGPLSPTGPPGPPPPLTAIYDSLPWGAYTATAIDARGCLTTTLQTLLDPAPLMALDSTWAAICPASPTGGVALTPVGGTPDYMVQWSTNTGIPDSTVNQTTQNALVPGAHNYTLTDAAGCIFEGLVTVSGPDPFLLSVVPSAPICPGDSSGELALTIEGGTEPIDLTFNGTPATPPYNWLNLLAGSYQVSFTDGAGCTGDTAITLADAQPADFQLSLLPVLCAEDSALLAWTYTPAPSDTLNPAPPATATWTVPGLAPQDSAFVGAVSFAYSGPQGAYSISITSPQGCAIDTAFELTALSQLTASTTVLHPDCQGQDLGVAWISPEGAVGELLLIVEGAADSTVLEQLQPGDYPYAIMDELGCVFRDTITVLPASNLALQSTSQDATCADSADGEIQLESSGAEGAVSYDIDNPDALFQAPSTFTQLGAGSHVVTATDEAGCEVSLTVEVAAPAAVQIVIDSLQRPSCTGDADGFIDVSATGGTPDYSFFWTLDGLFLSDSSSLSGMSEGTYMLTATDAAGCQQTIDQLQIFSTGDVTLETIADTALCQGTELTLEAQVQGAASVAWTINSAPASSFETVTQVLPETLTQDTSLWTVTATQQACIKSQTVQVIGWVNPIALAGPDLQLSLGGQAIVGLPTSPIPEGQTWWWTPADALEDPSQATPLLSPLTADLELTLTVTSTEGCTAHDTVLVHLIPTLGAPSGFTPNGDGWNDIWHIDGAEAYPSLEVIIFNRWGAVLTELSNPTQGWDGKLAGVPLPVGTYFYLFRAIESFAEIEQTGTLTIMR